MARLAVVAAAAAGMAGLTVATAGAAGPQRGAGSAAGPSRPAGSATRAHIEAVSAPVLVTAAELAQAEHADQASAAAGPAPAAPAPAAPATPAGSAAPARVHTTASSSSSSTSGGAGTDLGTFMVTCYDIHGRTASGEEAGPQSVAVDPSVIPLGTEIYIDGVGYRRADDTGGGVRGHHIDIWESSYSACADFGRQYRDVHRAS
ncbi:MAG TPA: 3D domain-containing protein [Acidimicrobiales bacterium]|nr:3D domain-containing protein [Acidimicrobiales bacterium]